MDIPNDKLTQDDLKGFTVDLLFDSSRERTVSYFVNNFIDKHSKSQLTSELFDFHIAHSVAEANKDISQYSNILKDQLITLMNTDNSHLTDQLIETKKLLSATVECINQRLQINSQKHQYPDTCKQKDCISVVHTVFTSRNTDGDFNWMIGNPHYKDALFVFNDNEEYYGKCGRGKGNAEVRPYTCFKLNGQLHPRSWGIPTGTLRKGGYTSLTVHVKSVIDTAIEKIKEIVKKCGYKTVIYSGEKDGSLGTGIFNVSSDVKTYFVSALKAAFA
jgi:hypothetical protein